MVRSIAPALLLFASATSYEAENESADSAVAEYSESEGQESNVYRASEENYWDPKTSEEEQETVLPCIESCPIPCAVQKIYLEQFINDDGEALTKEHLEKMCDIVKGMEEKIYEELEKVLPGSVDEALAFGLKVLEGDKGKLELAKEALEYAVMGKDMYEAKAEIEVPADASASDFNATNQLELSLPKNAVQDAANEETQTEATLSAITEIYEPELPLTTKALKEEITTSANNADNRASFLAEKKSYTPKSYGHNAPSRQSINAQIPEQLPVIEAQTLSTPSKYENHYNGLTATPKPRYQAYTQLYTPGTYNAPVGEPARAYPSSKTGAATSFNSPSVSTRNLNAYTAPRAETKPQEPVESASQNKHYVSSHKHRHHDHANPAYNGGH